MIASRLVGLTALGLALATQAVAQPTNDARTAEELFRNFEKQVQEGKSLFVAYVGEQATKQGPEITRSYYGGTYHVRPGIDRVTKSFDQSHAQVRHHFVGSTENYYTQATRTGFVVTGPYAWLLLPVSEFKFVKPKAGADPIGSQIIAYTVHLNMKEKTSSLARQVTLWLDGKTLAPIKRSVRWTSEGHEFEATERYYGFSTAEIPEPYQREAVPAFVVNGKLSAKIGTDWVASPWMVEGILYRAEEDARLLFGGGAKFTLAPTTEFIFQKTDRMQVYELHLSRGRLSANLGSGDPLLVLGPARLASGPGLNRDVVVTATPDRVVVEQGTVEYEGVTAEPSSEAEPFSLSGRLLDKGVEYRLADGKLQGQKERFLPRPDRLK
jgi:hypothetical protein